MNKRASKPTSASPTPGQSHLSKAALRLLGALGVVGSSAYPDPSREGTLLLRTSRSGISLGGGTHPIEAGAELLRHDLVEPTGRRGELRISAVGQAHLRRRGAGGETTFQEQHRDLAPEEVIGEDGPETVVVNGSESPLLWLARRRDRDGQPLIDPASYEAGERFRRDLTIGGVLPSVTARWTGAIGGGGAGRDPAAATDAMVAARQRVTLATEAVGAEFSGLLIDLCGFLKGLEQIERERRWPPRSGKVVVRLALARLAEHYGLERVAYGPERSRGIRTWQSAEEAASRSG